MLQNRSRFILKQKVGGTIDDLNPIPLGEECEKSGQRTNYQDVLSVSHLWQEQQPAEGQSEAQRRDLPLPEQLVESGGILGIKTQLNIRKLLKCCYSTGQTKSLELQRSLKEDYPAL